MDGNDVPDAQVGQVADTTGQTDGLGTDATPDTQAAKPTQQTDSANPPDTNDVPLNGLGEGEDAADQNGDSIVGAPEGDYDFSEVKLPDGFSLSESAVSEFSKVAKELNLSQAAASKLVERVGPAIEQAQAQRIEALSKDWINEAYADADLGGVNWKATMADANRALNQFAPQRVKQILAATGLNKNPDVIRMFRDIGRATGQDRIITGKPSAPKVDPLAYLYNNSNMN